ncbi:zinc ribbon domain-containing protein [Exiguobacterium sp. s193]|uniref:zinc ribbon domain-containing protein n=1 Tax=Exiguobacterium sp. s193 TaxID=2751207 RepID=UPI001BE97676|nr:zinc ribbon domain-containing protein [Exiguobacterium sp. s193]
MERCSLCGTPLKAQDTACSHCQHPVIAKNRLRTSSASESKGPNKRYPIVWLIGVGLVVLLALGSWYWFAPTKMTQVDNPSNVQPLALSEWSDEETAYNQTYSEDRPPTSYDVLKFVRQYTQTIPELVTYSRQNDSYETFAAIQFATLGVFKSEFSSLQALAEVSDSPVPPTPYTINFDQFRSTGAVFEVETTEMYKIGVTENQFVTYAVHYTVRLHTDHLQITNVMRKEVGA